MQGTLGWQSAHIMEFSLSGMVATKLAAAHPTQVDSLVLIIASQSLHKGLASRCPCFEYGAWWVQDTLGWQSAHIVGFSLGGMVATKLAAAHPNRVDSLALIASSLGGWHAIPWAWKAWKYAFRLLCSMEKEPGPQRAKYDVKFHFTRKALKQCGPLFLLILKIICRHFLCCLRIPCHGSDGLEMRFQLLKVRRQNLGQLSAKYDVKFHVKFCCTRIASKQCVLPSLSGNPFREPLLIEPSRTH
jgi:pimeloyl-ACP methyl ester carboxylesterase